MLKMMIRLAALLVGLSALLPFTASAATSAPLLSAAELKPLLEQAEVRVLDIRTPQDYAAGHIPGAVNTPYSAYRGPADNAGALRDENELTELLRGAGIDQDTQVIVAHAGSDQTDFGAAARVYWTLKVGGLSRLSVLDGGTQGWSAAGGSLETAVPDITPSTFSYHYDQDQIVHTAELAKAVEAGQAPVLLDARPVAFFNGEQRVDAAARYGTLPGARDLEYASFFDANGTTLKPVAELRAIAQQAGVADAPTVSFCNTGHWAATNWFVLSEMAGNEQVRLYPESVVEWSTTDMPMDNQPSRLGALMQDAKRVLQ